MLICNGTVLTDNGFNKQLSIRVTGDKLSEIGEALQPAAGETILNLDGDYLLPGFVDDL
jgi:dihydroorotase-like cyclic amidohydrolase